jgi:hypothetical protein
MIKSDLFVNTNIYLLLLISVHHKCEKNIHLWNIAIIIIIKIPVSYESMAVWLNILWEIWKINIEEAVMWSTDI